MIRFVLGAFVAAVVSLGAAPVHAQELPSRPFGQDYHAFRFVLSSLGLTPLTDPTELNGDPARTVLIIAGDGRAVRLPDEVLARYINRGGSVLIATDRPTFATPVERVGVRIPGEHVIATDEQFGYRGLRECPLAAGVKRHPLFANVSKPVATNVPSFIERTIEGYTEAAAFPVSTDAPDSPRYSRVFAVTFEGEKQRVLAVADQSVFINSMMLQSDTGNFTFAWNCMTWITDNGHRNRVLFLDDGEPVSNFEVSVADIPDLQLGNLPLPPAEAVNRILAALQDDNIHNRLLLERFSLNQILRAIAAALTALVVAYAAYRLWGARYSTEPGH